MVDPSGERPLSPGNAPKGYEWVWIRNDPFDPNLNSSGKWILQKSMYGNPGYISRSKPRGTKGACFWRVYPSYRAAQRKGSKYQDSPQKACEAANKKCASHIKCGVCGPYAAPIFTQSCLGIGNFANSLRDDCGGPPGADKLAHCWAACMAGMCGGIAGAAVWRFGINRGDIVEDKAAEGHGFACSCQGIRGRIEQPARSKSEHCIKCCGPKIKGMMSNG